MSLCASDFSYIINYVRTYYELYRYLTTLIITIYNPLSDDGGIRPEPIMPA